MNRRRTPAVTAGICALALLTAGSVHPVGAAAPAGGAGAINNAVTAARVTTGGTGGSGSGSGGSINSGSAVISRIRVNVLGGGRAKRPTGPRCRPVAVSPGHYAGAIVLVGEMNQLGIAIPAPFDRLLADDLDPTTLVIEEWACNGRPQGVFEVRTDGDPGANGSLAQIVGSLMVTTPTRLPASITPDPAGLPAGQRAVLTIDPNRWRPVDQRLTRAGVTIDVRLVPKRFTFQMSGVDGEQCTNVPGPGLGFDPGRGVEAQSEDPGRCSFVVPPRPATPARTSLGVMTVDWHATATINGVTTDLGLITRPTLVQVTPQRLDTAIRGD